MNHSTSSVAGALFVFAALISSPMAYGQPIIHSLFIEEKTNELLIKGEFIGDSGTVTIDSEPVIVKSWIDSAIIVNLPRSGKGAFGPVQVRSEEGMSNALSISHWMLNVEGLSWHYYSKGMVDETNVKWQLDFRAPIESLLLSGSKVGRIWVRNMSGGLTSKHQHIGAVDDPNDQDYTQVDTIPAFQTLIEIDIDNRTATLQLPEPRVKIPFSFDPPLLRFDSTFIISSDQSLKGTGGGGSSLTWSGATDFAVRAHINMARHPLTLVEPADSSIISVSTIGLSWNPASWATIYELEIAANNLFTNHRSDHSTFATSFALSLSQEQTEYYWRVRPRNDTIVGPWSDVRYFRTQSASVGKGSTNTSSASDWGVYDLEGRKILQFSGSHSDIRKMGVSRGVYILMTNGQRSQVYFIP